jgi:hypothetical protein
MRQHAIPQNILDIEFKLFTKFTVREFVYMAIGVGFGGIFLYYFTLGQVPGIIAFPVFIASSTLGLVLGLVNINDQKADVFFRNYIWAITHPTQRVWKNELIDERIEQIKPEFNVTQGSTDRTQNQENVGTEIIGGNADAVPAQYIDQSKLDEFDKEERARLAEIDEMARNTAGVMPQATQSTPVAPQPVAQTNMQSPLPQTQTTPDPSAQPTPVSNPTPAVQSIRIDMNNIAQYSTEISKPGPYAGNLNFKVVDKQGQPVNQAILVIKDQEDRVVSALQSDANGEVLSNKPFPPSMYNIQIQSNGQIFPKLQLLLDGTEIKPIKITAN